MTDDNVSLDIRCPWCWGEMVVECVDWDADAELRSWPIACPYCTRINEIHLPSRVVWVSRRPGDGPTPHRDAFSPRA